MQEKKRFPKLNPRRKMLLGVEVLLLLLAASGLFRSHTQITLPATEFAGVIAEDGSSTGTVKSDKIALQAGTYRVRLSYVTPDDQVNVWSVQNSDDSTVSADGLLANTCMLYSGLNETEMMIYVTEQVEVQVCVTSAEGSTVEITGCTLARTDHASAMWITGLLIVFLLIHLLLGLGPKSKQDRATVFALTVIILIASLPILNGYTIAGADTIYHMLRIEGVK
ncbi:MAG: hypothetical protein K6G23_05945, partial [Lachnospiraceae bacterium]|nr:hypothetical protein [Lachnospiraceae bacterium]